jgi:hypothetical protein
MLDRLNTALRCEAIFSLNSKSALGEARMDLRRPSHVYVQPRLFLQPNFKRQKRKEFRGEFEP